MPLERRLQIWLYGLIFLSTFLLAIVDHDSPWPLTMLGVIPLSWLFADYLGWTRFFTGFVANCAAVCGFVYFVIDIQQSGPSQYLPPVINLLMILVMVLLLQEKQRRRYWFLLTLSIMQVMIAAAMNLHTLFSLLLFAYVGIAIKVLSLMTLWSETLRWSQPSAPTPAAPVAPASPEKTPAAPAAAVPATAVPATAVPATAVEALHAGLWRPIAMSAFATAAFALFLHNVSPRLQGDQLSGANNRRKLVGLSREMSLNDMNRILLSDELAMRVNFTNAASGQIYQVAGDLYMRGTAYQRYATATPGRWEPPIMLELRQPPTVDSLVNAVEQDIWLEPTPTATLFAIGPVFRTADTANEIQIDPRTQELIRLSPPSPQIRTRWQYRLGTTGLTSSRQLPLTPDPRFRDRLQMGNYYQEVRDCQFFDRRRFPRIAAIAEEALRAADALGGDTIRKTRVLEAHFLQSDRYSYSLTPPRNTTPERDPIESFVADTRSGHCQYFATALALMLRSQRIPARVVSGYHGGEFNEMGGYWQFRQRDAHAWVEVHLLPSEVADLNLGKPDGELRGGWWRIDPTPSAQRDQDIIPSRWSQMLDYAEFTWSDLLAGVGGDRPPTAGSNRFVEALRERFAFLADILAYVRQSYTRLREFLQSPGWKSGWLLAGSGLMLAAAILLRATRHRWLPRFAHWKKRLESASGAARRHRVRRSKLDFFDRFEQLLAAAGLGRAASDTPREWLENLLRAGLPPSAALPLSAGPSAETAPTASTAPALATQRAAATAAVTASNSDSSPAGPAATAGPAAPGSSIGPVGPVGSVGPGGPVGPPDLPGPADPLRPTFDQFTAAARDIVERFYRVRYGGIALAPPDRATVDQALAVIADFLRPRPASPPRSSP